MSTSSARALSTKLEAVTDNKPRMSQAGIGCRISRYGKDIVIDEVVGGGAADRNGNIDHGDIIRLVDGSRVNNLDDVRNLIVGPVGTNVTITLERSGSTLEVVVERGPIMSRQEPPKEVVLNNGKTLKTFGMKVNPKPVTKPAQPVTKSHPFVCSVAPGDMPPKVDLRKYMSEVEHQNQTNSCCACAVAGAYEYLLNRVAKDRGAGKAKDISRLFIYYVGRRLERAMYNEPQGPPLEDCGMTIEAAIESMKCKGACLETTWDFDMSKINCRPMETCYDEARQFKVASAESVECDEEAMKAVLAEGFPIIFGLKLTQRFFAPGSSGVITTPDPSDPQAAEHGAHAMLIVGYSDEEECFIVRNSWGTEWGDQGYCYVPYDYAANTNFNLAEGAGQFVIKGLDDYNFGLEAGDDTPLFDPAAAEEPYTPPGYEVKESVKMEALPEEEEDPEDSKKFNDAGDPWEESRQIFKKLDTDGSGFLDKDELRAAYRLNGIKISDAQLVEIIKIYDTSQDGKISFAEYCKMVKVEPPPGEE